MNFDNVLRFLNLHESQSFRTKVYDTAASTVFMHILKTAGTALTRGLIAAIAPRRAVYGIDRVLFGEFNSFESIDPDVRCCIYLDAKNLPQGADLVAGHISFSTLLQRYRTAQYITVLREPVSRILSHWLYWRAQPDDELRKWGDWADRVYKSRGPLVDFLSCRDIACQIDNLCVRMLLWPHRLIPNNDFIDTCNDEVLVSQAAARLKQFAYFDIVENPRLETNLQAWLGRPFIYTSANETPPVPPALKTPLHYQLNSDVLDLLEMRARLDLKLWMAVARARVPRVNLESLRTHTIALNVARHSWLMMA